MQRVSKALNSVRHLAIPMPRCLVPRRVLPASPAAKAAITQRWSGAGRAAVPSPLPSPVAVGGRRLASALCL